MKRILCVLIGAVLLGGCGAASGAEKAVDKMLGALQAGKLGRAESCTVEGTLGFDGRTRDAKDFYKAMFAAMDYTVADTQLDGETAAVTVAVTAVNMDVFVAAEGAALLDGALGGEKRDSKRFYTDLAEKLKNEQLEPITAVATAYVVKTDGGWRVDIAGSTAFADAITGGMRELIT